MRATFLSVLAVTAMVGAGVWQGSRLRAEDQSDQSAVSQEAEQGDQQDQEQAAFNRELLYCAAVMTTETTTEPAGEAVVVQVVENEGATQADAKTPPAEAAAPAADVPTKVETAATPTATAIKPGRIPGFVTKGAAWLIAAQHNGGGWGAGSHAHQEIRDPHAATPDPATTSFTLLALLRAGHTPVKGEYKAQVRRGLEYLVGVVEKAPKDGALITDVESTQPQAKLGRYVDTAMTAQYLARALSLLAKDDELYARVDKALDVCLTKLQQSQHANGSWGDGGGWAPVLQSSLSCSALELAQASGKTVDATTLNRARTYQKSNYNAATGAVDASAAAGVDLYAFNGAFRGNAAEARFADQLVAGAKQRGEVAADAPVNAETLRQSGAQGGEEAEKLAAAHVQNQAQIARLSDEQLQSGFGNNGGEEFLSYLMTSETLVIAGGDKFAEWQDKMQGRLAKIQNADGSWSGHHCITSPVFCTAAVIQCVAADQDVDFLVAMAQRTTGAQPEAQVAATK